MSQNAKSDIPPPQTPGERHLAIKLIKRFGYHESIRQCRENKWHGTLEEIQRTHAPALPKKTT
ncbi:hypothetical protein [Luteithermobacter gelatinilyticus]|uniref:hypothetical protein n=1 Tax=Luteithermobacter gelatinilyticus TaxID=2582913 RepID=UPI001106D225|nr:hypothetical protein [Luteithermobacter gelatinilyticus]